MKSKFTTLLITTVLVALGLIASSPTPTSAAANQTLSCGQNSIPIPGPRIPETGFANQGDSLKIVEVTVPTELQGKNVPASAEITNALSVRSGSNITIESNGTSFVLNDVENAPDKVTTASGPLTLGGTVDVILTFGVGGLFSGGGVLTIEVDCPPSSQPLVCGINTLQIPQTVVRGANGSITKLAELTVPSNLQGDNVSATAESTNNVSVHPGTQFIISSDATSFTVDDVEGVPNKVTSATGNLTLGSTVDVSVKLGPDGVFSGGGLLTITIDCPPPPPPTVPPVTPPEGGRGGEVLTTKVVEVPKVVSAGAGGTMETNSAAVFGLTGSLAMLGLGLRRLNKDVL